MSHDENPTNPTDNRPFEDILEARLQRRTVLAGGVALAATTFFAAGPAGAAVASATGDADAAAAGGPLIGFEPIPLSNEDMIKVSPDYNVSVVIPWGTPLKNNTPPFSWPPSSADQERQVGIGHDGMWFFPTGRGSNRQRRGVLCINHEFGRNTHVFGKAAPENLEDVRTSQAAHGISMVEIRQTTRGNWEVVPGGRRSRRVHVNTPVEFSGPVAGSPLLDTPSGVAPTGTLNNCSSGYTPWGTYLTCEENFNGYYGATSESWEPTESQTRYGFTPTGFGYGWENFDPRFDLADADHTNAENRFGWVVEVDPYRQSRTPVKRTALGRFKHEGVALTIGKDSRAVAYMGDDQRFDYIYKFVSNGNYRTYLRRRQSPLDDGVLYVARFNEDGTGDWLELSMAVPALAERFDDMADLLVNTRLAADIVGATPMDRPEWTTIAPNGDVYCTLTNNSRRTEDQVDAANPQGPNNNGHIIRWHDSDDHTGATFDWDIFLLADDLADTDSAFGSPDGIWADPDGRLFIQTDGRQPLVPGTEDNANDQMLVADTSTGEIKRMVTGVPSCEITGVAVTPNRKTMFINIQHPGNGDPAVSQFPGYDGSVPRDATLALTRKDGGIIGS